MSEKKGMKQKLVEIRYYGLIRQLRIEGFSWEKIEKYLKQYHQFKISRVHLKACFENVSKKRLWIPKE